MLITFNLPDDERVCTEFMRNISSVYGLAVDDHKHFVVTEKHVSQDQLASIFKSAIERLERLIAIDSADDFVPFRRIDRNEALSELFLIYNYACMAPISYSSLCSRIDLWYDDLSAKLA